MTAPARLLAIEPLSAAAFRDYGDVIEAAADATRFGVNQGSAERFHDLATLDTAEAGGRPIVSIFRAQPRVLPMPLMLLERHRLGSQAFMPLAPRRFLVVVARAAPQPEPWALRCFLASPGQGVNFARGTWHHPLLMLDEACDVLVIDRGAPGAVDDCEEVSMEAAEVAIGPV